MIPGQPVPLAPRTDSADACPERREEYLRRLLAEGRLSPSRRRMVQAELREAERAAA